MVGPGNHERFYNWSAFTNRYHMPSNPDLVSDGNFWYTFDYGNVHWISISSEHDLTAGSAQNLFLIAALKAAVANRATVPWIVLSLHKPMYTSCDGWGSEYRDKLESIVLEYDVDLVVAGHLHGYERVHPVKAGEVTVMPVKGNTVETLRTDVYYSLGKGPIHILTGHSGGMQVERWDQPAPSWSAIRMANGYIVPNISDDKLFNPSSSSYMMLNGIRVDISDASTQTDAELRDLPMQPPQNDLFNYTDTYGFSMISTLNATHLHFQTYSDTGSTKASDEFWIVKDRTSVVV